VQHEAGAQASHDAIRKRAASELWQVIQGAHDALEGVTRAKREPKPVLEQLQAQLDGIATTALAMLDSPRFRRAVDTVTGEVFEPLTVFLERFASVFGGDEGKARVEARQARLGLDVVSDTTLSCVVRADHLRILGTS
jgi:hypothetical protein